ncbi:MAG: hypothetical protein ABIN79_00020 [Marmoricola sp.]
MSTLLLLPLAAEESAGLMPYAVGGLALVILLAMLLALMSFGKGREHS